MHWRYFSRAGGTHSHGTSLKPKSGQCYINKLVWTNSNPLFQTKATVNKLGTAGTHWSHSGIMQGRSGEGPAAPSTPLPGREAWRALLTAGSSQGDTNHAFLHSCPALAGRRGSERNARHGETALSPSSPCHGATQQLLHGLM